MRKETPKKVQQFQDGGTARRRTELCFLIFRLGEVIQSASLPLTRALRGHQGNRDGLFKAIIRIPNGTSGEK